jgi:adenine-specific DNA methylase
MDAATTRRLFRAGKAGQRMVAVVEAGQGGKTYRLPTDADLDACRAAVAALDAACERLRAAWGMEPVPDEPIPTRQHEVDRLPMYGMKSWGDVFNPRQALALITFADAVRRAHTQMLAQGYADEFATAVTTYLGLSLDMLAAFTNSLARWENTSEAIKHLFARQALPMLWDYAEANPLCDSSGSFSTGQEYYLKVLDHLTRISPLPGGGRLDPHPRPLPHFGGGEIPP